MVVLSSKNDSPGVKDGLRYDHYDARQSTHQNFLSRNAHGAPTGITKRQDQNNPHTDKTIIKEGSFEVYRSIFCLRTL